MSYPGPQQQFGLSDLQLLQQQLMLAQLQELQKQQQFGQLGDGKPSNSVNSMPLYAKHAVNAQIPNQGSGSPFNASNMISSNNQDWMLHSFSSSMQGVNRGLAYSPGEGLMMNPDLQQPDNSFYGTPVASGRDNSGLYSPMQGVSRSSVYMLSVNSNEKPISTLPMFGNPFLGDKPSVLTDHGHSIDKTFTLSQALQGKGLIGQASDQMLNSGIFLQERTKQTSDSRNTATLDPLEEKILFDTEDSGWDTSFSKLAAFGTEEFLGASSRKEFTNAFSSIQSGSWSALMQSAVAEASSSDTGIQEELSGLSFQNTDSTIWKQPSNQWIDSKLQGSSNMEAPQSSVDSMLMNGPVPVGHSVNDLAGLNDKNSRDLSQGSRTSALSGMYKNDYELIQQAVDCYDVPINCDTDHKNYQSMVDGHQSSSNPMAVGALYKRAAEIYGNQNRYQGENSCDSYNSKVSQAYLAQADHASLNVEDSESSGRSSHKSQNQALCVSSPGANSQQECFSHFKSNNAFPSNTDSMMKGKPNFSADAFSKGSPASDMSASFDSQNTTEHNKASQSTDHRSTVPSGFNISQRESQELDMPKISVSQGTAILDRFSFQSSVPKDSRLSSLGNGQSGKTWWMPSSSGHYFPTPQGDSLSQSCSVKYNILEKTAIETSNLSERKPLEALFSGHLNVNNQLNGMSFPEMSRHKSVSGFSPTQDFNPLKNISSFGHEHTASGAFPVTESMAIGGLHNQGVKPLNVWKDVPGQKNMMGLSSLDGMSSRSSAMGKDRPDEQNAPMLENVNLLRSHESAEKYPTISTDAMAYAESYINQQGYVDNGLQMNSSGTTLRALPTYCQPQHNVGKFKKEEDIGDTGLKKMDYISSAPYSINKQRIPDFPVQQSLHERHQLAKIYTGSRFDLCSPSDKIIPLLSGVGSSVMEISSGLSALQDMYPHRGPVFSQGYSKVNRIFSDRTKRMQNDLKTRQTLSLCDSAALTSIEASQNVQLSGNIALLKGISASRKYDIVPGPADQMVTIEQSIPSSMLPSDTNVNLVSKPKKRKTAMYDCLPWDKVVIQTCQVLPDISTAEQEWAEVTNRLIEKFVDEGEKSGEMLPAVCAKRRLILTTKLMQMVFRPPPPSILSIDSNADYEIMAYSITKLALADACCLANKSSTDCNTSREFGGINRSGRMADNLSYKATEFFQRVKELESHIERLSKGISVVDVLVECQELDRFGLINHFARYHSRVPDPVATDLASSSTGMISVRPFLRRYVSAVPLPLKLPEGVQCLSL